MANWTAFTVGAATLAVILLLKGNKRIPGILVAVIGATVVVGVLNLAASADVSVLGPLPQGLPAFAIPWITYADIVPVLIGGLPSRSFPSPTPACSRASMRRVPAPMSIPTRKWSGWAPPTSPPDFFRAFRSAAARHAPR